MELVELLKKEKFTRGEFKNFYKKINKDPLMRGNLIGVKKKEGIGGLEEFNLDNGQKFFVTSVESTNYSAKVPEMTLRIEKYYVEGDYVIKFKY